MDPLPVLNRGTVHRVTSRIQWSYVRAGDQLMSRSPWQLRSDCNLMPQCCRLWAAQVTVRAGRPARTPAKYSLDC